MILRCPQGHIYDDFDREHECPHDRDNTMLYLGAVGIVAVVAAALVFICYLVSRP
jgi:hypothetical protein